MASREARRFLAALGLVACAPHAASDPPPARPGTESRSSPAARVENSPGPGRSEPSTAPVPGGLARGVGTPSDAALLAGDRAYVAGDTAAARAHYEGARRLAPDDPAPEVGLLRVRLAELDVPLAYASREGDPPVRALLEIASELARRHADYAPAHVERGRLLLVLGRADEALDALRRGAAASPSDPEAQSSLGVALLATGHGAEAVGPFERAAAHDPRTASRHANLGTAYMMASRLEDAIRAYRGALNLAPNDARAHSDLATAYLASGHTKDALGHLERAVTLEPERATFLSNLGYAYQELGELERAVTTCKRALALDERLGSAWINLGTALARQGRIDEAKEALEKARTLDPEDPRVRAVLDELEQMRKKQ